MSGLKRYSKWVALAVVVAVASFLSTQLRQAPEVELPDAPSKQVSVDVKENEAAADTLSSSPKSNSADGLAALGRAAALPGANLSAVPGRLIVKFKEGVSQAGRANARRQERIQVVRELGLVRAELVSVEGRTVADAVRALRQRPDVEYAEPDHIRKPSGYWDFYNNDSTVHDAVDNDAHGTHVAGTIAASVNGQGIVGVAPNVKIMALKFLGPNGGSTSDAIDAIGYATKKGVRISNNSWGGPGYSQALKDAIERSGQLFVAAAGNSSKNQDTSADPDYPAGYNSANVLSVAAVDNRGALASFSNYGATTVDISAPGVNILSSVPGGYSFYSGTSMAAPHVTGVAALAKSVNSALTPADMKNIMMSTGAVAPSTSGKTVTGAIVRARAALSKADTTAPTVKAPVQSLPVATMGTVTVPVTLTWPAATDAGSGVARYQLQQGTNGTYSDVTLSSELARSKYISLSPGSNKYPFMVRAYDRVGNVSAWASGPTFTLSAYQESNTAIVYSGTWKSQSLSGAYGGAVRYATAGGASAKITFSGRNVSWVSRRSTTSGKAEIYLDGARVATVDLYSSTAQTRRVVFSRAVTTGTSHTLQVRVLGTSGRPRVDLDAFMVLR